MKTKNNFLNILLISFCILLLIDICIRLWFTNNFNLYFDSSEFNNLVTPTLTILATIIYTCALFTTINQNKIILSQNIKPYYEKEIEKHIIKTANTKITNETIYSDENINGKNYMKYIVETLSTIGSNQQYNEDYDKYLNNEILTVKHFMDRNYIYHLMFLSKFTIGINEIMFLHSDLKALIIEINQSKLIEEDKNLLKKQIKRNFLIEYMEFIELENLNKNLFAEIPYIFQRPQVEKVEFLSLSKTNFGNDYSFFKKEL